jgi:hypothetical protein
MHYPLGKVGLTALDEAIANDTVFMTEVSLL